MLYDESVNALEGELKASEALRLELMKTHWAVLKVHTWVEGLQSNKYGQVMATNSGEEVSSSIPTPTLIPTLNLN